MPAGQVSHAMALLCCLGTVCLRVISAAAESDSAVESSLHWLQEDATMRTPLLCMSQATVACVVP
jgi:hypothetical protein